MGLPSRSRASDDSARACFPTSRSSVRGREPATRPQHSERLVEEALPGVEVECRLQRGDLVEGGALERHLRGGAETEVQSVLKLALANPLVGALDVQRRNVEPGDML